MRKIQRMTIDDLIKNVVITSDKPIDEASIRDRFGRYAKILTTETELSLGSDLSDDDFWETVVAVARKAAYFATIREGEVPVDSGEQCLHVMLGGLGCGGGLDVVRAQNRDVLEFAEAAKADGMVTFEEVIDFHVLRADANEDPSNLQLSSLAAARFCLIEKRIDPTPERVNALARAAEVAVNSAADDY